ncbi:MAG TPA: TIGR03960 family B12-binding radical SAM protein [Candidatus Edwardsbacteria bacterium]|nr:TIGR03960 family B12-binding radical SAM protein [Candidatus Edwardsbacteria bacterium]
MNDPFEQLLAAVARPGRYADHELGAARKDWDGAAVRVALAFPDLYEIGMSGLGVAILYRIVNRLPGALADRSYCPDVDLERRLRGAGIPLWGWETRRPLAQFDIVGFSLQTELSYTNVLSMLDLAGLPLRAADRTERQPIVIAGGACCANPMPMAPFIDAFVIGDGEEAIVEICQLLKNTKSETRDSKLRELAKIAGVYVPAVHDPARDVVTARITAALRYQDAPQPPLVPLVEATHDRLTLEIARGCTRGCRFCQAGMAYRPLRLRPPDDVMRLAAEGIAASGWDEIGLLSLSSCDYPGILPLVTALNGRFAGQRVSVSMPSLRLDSFDDAMAAALQRISKSGLTFAPEAGSQRLRDVINKGVSDGQLLAVLRAARRHGWSMVKLYFMTGLPTETEADLEALAQLCHQGAALGINIKASISPFVPKAHTPFQWEAQDTLETSSAKIELLRRKVRGGRVQLKWHEPAMSALEGVLARGDARIADAIEAAWRGGCRFDQWSEHFDWPKWTAAFQRCGIDHAGYLKERGLASALPWQHIRYGVSREFLLREREQAYHAAVTPDCRAGSCNACGHACRPAASPPLSPMPDVPPPADASAGQHYNAEGFGRGKKRMAAPVPVARTKYRLQYTKGPEVRFISHLDMMRLWQRAIRRSGLPVAYSQGFSPHQKIAFGPPLALGHTSRAECLDLQLERPAAEDVAALLNRHLVPGVRVLDARPVFRDASSIVQLAQVAEYGVALDPSQGEFGEATQAALQRYRQRVAAGTWPVEVMRKEQRVTVDIAKQLYDLAATPQGLLVKVALVEGGAKFNDILAALLGSDHGAVAGLDIERTGLFRRDGQRLVPLMDRSLL